VEVAAERQWSGDVVVGVRAFRQRVTDQSVTMFGLSIANGAPSVGHYHVGSAGDFEASGWGVSVSRTVSESVRASIDYTQVDAEWSGPAPDREMLIGIAGSLLRTAERLHDLTASVETNVAPTATRVFVLYKLNTGFASRRAEALVPGSAGRFDVRVNQSLPFFGWTGAQWEMLVAVSNLFREESFDASVYDELMVLRPPKRLVGGVAVRF
jgi:hypothetical protein